MKRRRRPQLLLNGKRSKKLTTLITGIEDAYERGQDIKLASLGITDDDLTQDFLLGSIRGYLPRKRVISVLQLLVESRCLDQIPERLLDKKVVFSKTHTVEHFVVGDHLPEPWRVRVNLLLLCAKMGIYQQLPYWCQSRGILLHSTRGNYSVVGFAAWTGTFANIPFELLEEGDIKEGNILCLIENRELPVAERLLGNSDLNVELVAYCFTHRYVPACIRKWIRRNLRPVEITDDLNHLLDRAVQHGVIFLLPPSRFIQCFHDVRPVIETAKVACPKSFGGPVAFKEYCAFLIRSGKDLNSVPRVREIKTFINKADRWLIILAHKRLKKYAKELPG